MIKRYGINKFLLGTFLLILICILSIFPNNKLDYDVLIEETNKLNNVVYLLDDDNYLSLLNVYIGKNEIVDIIKEKLILLRDGYEDYSDFKTLIPKDTIINNISVEENNVYIDFNESFLDVGSSLSKSMIESIVYSVTEINGINNIYISINNNMLDTYPNTNIKLNMPLNRNIGINTIYDIENLNKVSKTTMYFIKENNNIKYYIPVTKISNNNDEKISIIIDELKSSVYSMDNLQSYLNNNLELYSYKVNDDSIDLIFNDYIFENIETNKILEEVKYVISESIFENYNVKEVTFNTKNISNIETIFNDNR